VQHGDIDRDSLFSPDRGWCNADLDEPNPKKECVLQLYLAFSAAAWKQYVQL
jgi:hypothetical protein